MTPETGHTRQAGPDRKRLDELIRSSSNGFTAVPVESRVQSHSSASRCGHPSARFELSMNGPLICKWSLAYSV